MRKIILLSLVFTIVLIAQTKNKYGLSIIENIEDYYVSVKKDSNKTLVDLRTFIPNIVLDIRYATKNNFTGQILYKEAEAYLRLPAAIALKKVQTELNEMGLGIKIYDAYRPYSITELMWEYVKDDRYAADPKKGSRHNRGCAVDLTIIELSSGEELEMPTPYDDFTNKAHHAYMNLERHVIKNRALLKSLMEKYGFESITSEWWHYDFKGWSKYELMNISFSKIKEKRTN